MKVILLKDVDTLGEKGDLVEAKTGYARNYLLPRGLGIEATKKNMEKWKEDQKDREEKAKIQEDKALKLKEEIESLTIELKAKAGEGGRLFGSITSQDIGNALKEQGNINIDKRKIELEDNIKTGGITLVNIRVYPEITAELKVNVDIE